VGVATLSLGVLAGAPDGRLGAQPADKPEPKRPSFNLKATPSSGNVPLRVFVTAELRGGDDDFQEYYCPTVEWAWGDGTLSSSTADCAPYEAGKSQIRRRFTADHVYKRPGSVRLTLRLKQKDKVVGSVSTPLQLMGIATPY
jgi:hypothetical protein